ncbi:MAG: four-helix bundle copper-binding protein [Comamonadaceae bacterium]|nr:MAG: four-helix bundle copper-binding protein [Comamonadaceae bacterium]
MLEAPHTLALSRYLDSIAACTDCATACDFCAAACLREPDPRHMAKCIALDMDCAAVCRLAVSCMARDSAHVAHVCELCARMCESCAHECESHEAQHCQDCAQACKRCAQLCRSMFS